MFIYLVYMVCLVFLGCLINLVYSVYLVGLVYLVYSVCWGLLMLLDQCHLFIFHYLLSKIKVTGPLLTVLTSILA